MAGRLIAKQLELQGNIKAAGHGIDDLNIPSLGLVKADVGLGNVDNTSDANKPLSAAMITALALKENFITPGTTEQFLRGDKTWQAYGALALQDGATTLPLLSTRGDSASSNGTLIAKRNDSVSFVQLSQHGAAVLGNILTGLPAANVGMLNFEGASYGLIKTNNAATLVFGVNGTKRMRLTQGLNVGGDADPGAGCITAFGSITAGVFNGVGSGITGLVKEQIPTTLRASLFPSVGIIGVGGAGYLSFASQTSDPPSGAKIFANSLGRIAFTGSLNAFNASWATDGFTADRIFALLDATGTLPVIVTAPAATGDAGVAGSIAYTTGHIYVCVATDTWKRAALSTW